jgi:hypothetical protein
MLMPSLPKEVATFGLVWLVGAFSGDNSSFGAFE